MRDRIPVFRVLLQAVVLIEQGKKTLGIKIKTMKTVQDDKFGF